MKKCLFGLILAFTWLASAQTFPVDKLEVSGNLHIPTAQILNKIGFREGDQVDREKVLAGAKAIEAMGYFAQVVPEITIEEGKVVVRYRVAEFPKVEKVTIVGVPPEPKGGGTLWSWIKLWLLEPRRVWESKVREILEEHGVKPGEVLNRQNLEEGLKAVLEEYKKNDWVTVQVGQVIPGSELRIEIQELPVVAHEIRGLVTVPEEEAKKLITVPLGEVGRLSQIQGTLAQFNRSVYFSQAEVVPEVVVGGVKLVWEVTERTVLAEPAEIQEIRVEGSTVFPEERVRSLVSPLPQGMVTNAQALAALAELFESYRRDGYALVDFVGEGVRDGVLYVKVREGRLGRIEIQGAKGTEEWVIQRALELRPGQVLTEARLGVARQALMSLGYFSDVVLIPAWEGDEVVLRVGITELDKLGSIQGAISYSPESGGLVGNLTYSQKNLWGTAQDLSFSFARGLGEDKSSTWSFGYLSHSFPVFDRVSLDLYRKEEGGTLTLGGNFKVAYPIADYLSLDLGFLTEVPRKLDEPLPPRNALQVGFTYDDRDNPMFPRRGLRGGLSLEKAGTFAPGVEYVSLTGQAARFWPWDISTAVWEGRGALATRALWRLGLDLPKEYWFTLGGVDTVRGAQKLSTDNLALLNLELRLELAQGAWFSLFLDLGADLSGASVKSAPGMEVAVYIAGMFVRLSASWPNDREPTWVPAFEFGMSPMF